MNRLPPEAFGTAWIKEPFRTYEGERYGDTKYALTRNSVALAAKVVTIYVLEAYELDDGRSLVFATDWSEVLPAERKALLPDNEPDWTRAQSTWRTWVDSRKSQSFQPGFGSGVLAARCRLGGGRGQTVP